MVESMGIWQPSMLIKKGFENLLWKCNHIIGVLLGGEGNKYDGNYMAIDYVLTNQSHTMGNMIQEWIYNHEFGNSTDGNELSHISYRTLFTAWVLKEPSTKIAGSLYLIIPRVRR